MDRKTKIELLEYWLSNPGKIGDIPHEFENRVTTDDFFKIKKEMDWKPLTEVNVRKLLSKIKLIPGVTTTTQFNFEQLGVDIPKIIIPVIIVMFFIPVIFFLILLVFAGVPLFDMIEGFSVFPVIIFVIAFISVFSTKKKIHKKMKEGRRRDFHRSAAKRK